jgi:hypothetical protein
MSYENSSLRCRNCKFWWPLSDDQPDTHLRQHAKRGQCRRHAPPPVSADQEWAIVKNDDWCGEHSHVMIDG